MKFLVIDSLVFFENDKNLDLNENYAIVKFSFVN
jgi:hypothetical protein